MAFAFSEPLLLGVCDGPCTSLSLSPLDNKIGGLPDFFPDIQLDTPPSCLNCHGVMLHLLQAYCPQEGSVYHRLLHVFCCSQPLCWKFNSGWLVLRSQKRESPLISPHSPQQQVLSSVEDWCEDANDWGVIQDPGPSIESTELTIMTNTLNQLQLEEPRTIPQQYNSVAYPSFFISVFSAIDCQMETPLDKEELLRGYYHLNESQLGVSEGECYERAAGIDGMFYKFKKEMTKCPQQLIRYQRGGDPLLLEEVTTIPNCEHCGSPCVFELQLLPQIIYILQKGLREAALDPIAKNLTLPVVEYGTVLVYTCQQSCWSDESCQFHKESALVQQIDDKK